MKRYAILVASLLALTGAAQARLQKDQDLFDPGQRIQSSPGVLPPDESLRPGQSDEDRFSSEPAQTDTGRTELKGAIIPEQPDSAVGSPGLNEERGSATQSSDQNIEQPKTSQEPESSIVVPESPNTVAPDLKSDAENPYPDTSVDLQRQQSGSKGADVPATPPEQTVTPAEPN